MAMFLRTRRRVRPRVACLRGGAISGRLSWHSCSAAAKTKSGKDAGSGRSRRLRARPRTPPDAGLQRPAECAGRGRGPHSRLRRRLLAAADGLLRALARARVRLRPLAVDRQAAAVTDAAVRADLAESLDGLRPRAAQIALDLEIRVDVLAQLRHFLVGEVLDLRVGRETELGADLLRGRLTDPVDVRQPDLEPLLIRKIDSGDACQISLLALPLLVPRVRANDHGPAVPLDDATPLAHGLD